VGSELAPVFDLFLLLRHAIDAMQQRMSALTFRKPEAAPPQTANHFSFTPN
jgi:hypothetical protein